MMAGVGVGGRDVPWAAGMSPVGNALDFNMVPGWGCGSVPKPLSVVSHVHRGCARLFSPITGTTKSCVWAGRYLSPVTLVWLLVVGVWMQTPCDMLELKGRTHRNDRDSFNVPHLLFLCSDFPERASLLLELLKGMALTGTLLVLVARYHGAIP